MVKAAILLLADIETHGDMGRAANALMTVQEFKDEGDEVTQIFDGAGVRWASELAKPDNKLNSSFREGEGQNCGRVPSSSS